MGKIKVYVQREIGAVLFFSCSSLPAYFFYSILFVLFEYHLHTFGICIFLPCCCSILSAVFHVWLKWSLCAAVFAVVSAMSSVNKEEGTTTRLLSAADYAIHDKGSGLSAKRKIEKISTFSSNACLSE